MREKKIISLGEDENDGIDIIARRGGRRVKSVEVLLIITAINT